MKRRIAVLSTHPIQYYVPLYRELFSHPEIEGEVLYAARHGVGEASFDPGFGREVKWDIDLTAGYPSRFLRVFATFGKGSASAERWWTNVGAQLKKGRYDAVVVPGYRPLFEMQALAASFRLGIPVLIRPEGWDDPLGRSRFGAARKAYLRAIYRRIGAFLAIGRVSERHFIAHGGDATKVIFSPYCVDNAFFQANARKLQPQREALRAALNLPQDAVVVVASGKLIDRKRPMLLLDALARAKHREKIVLIWLGSGSLEAPARARAEAAKVDARFLGFKNQTELGAFYALADAHVLASAKETWGLVVNETMNYGLTQIVSSRVGCGEDLVSGRGTGAIFPSDDAAALARELDWLVENPTERKARGEQARRLIDLYGLSQAVGGIVEGVLRLTKGPSGR